MPISREELDEIVVALVESGCGAVENDWASHQAFAYALLTEVQKRLEVACFSVKDSPEYYSIAWMKTAKRHGSEIAETFTALPLVE